MTFDTSAKICIFLLASQDLIRVFSWFFLQKITMIRGSALRITLATLESAIAENGRSGDEKFPTFVQLADAQLVDCSLVLGLEILEF